MAYCENVNCEYEESGFCEYEGALSLDENGTCKRFRYGKENFDGDEE